MTTETAYFGAGCFWHPQKTFDSINGVVKTMVGYMGGTTKDPTYKQICSDTTGHIETTEVTFDPQKVSYEELLSHFWTMHDPTQYNRQGPDVGSQYRSVIFYVNDVQKKLSEKSKKEIEIQFKGKRVFTEIRKAEEFYPAEEYHQKYMEKK